MSLRGSRYVSLARTMGRFARRLYAFMAARGGIVDENRLFIRDQNGNVIKEDGS